MQINNLKKEFGDQLLFEKATFSINPGDRIGLVGKNGSGKSTFFKILLGELKPDDGHALAPKGYKLGSLSQYIKFTEPTVLQECSLALPRELREETHRVEKILFGLGFTKEDMSKAPSSFSGGYQVRMNLAKAILGSPNLLLLDEPTNYLDIPSLRWLRRFLKTYDGEVVLITHDQGFMDDVVTHIVGIHRKSLRKIQGNTRQFYHQIQSDEEIHEKTRVNQEKKKKELEQFVDRFRAKASKAAQAQSRLKQLEKMEVLTELEAQRRLQFQFKYAPCPGKVIMDVEQLSFGYQPDQLLFSDLSFALERNEKIAIIGKNGKGKSTLLNVLSGQLKSISGAIQFHPSIKLGHFGQTNVDRLSAKMTVEEEIRSANPDLSRSEIRSIAGCMMFEGELAEKKIQVLSGGEKSRVLLGKILATPSNLLFLDEPTNHLDMDSVESLALAMESFEGAICFVTHNEELIRRVATRLVVFHQDRAEYFWGGYDDFLEKIGWDEDKNQSDGAAKNQTKKSKKNRAEQVVLKSRELKPLQEQCEQIENVIAGLENLQQKNEENLMIASQKGESERIVTLSKEIADLRDKIESLFKKYEEISSRIEETEKRFN
jgi:ATP-binding cassette, subfamily F, member 3